MEYSIIIGPILFIAVIIGIIFWFVSRQNKKVDGKKRKNYPIITTTFSHSGTHRIEEEVCPGIFKVRKVAGNRKVFYFTPPADFPITTVRVNTYIRQYRGIGGVIKYTEVTFSTDEDRDKYSKNLKLATNVS